MRRKSFYMLAVLTILGMGLAVFLFKPVTAPPRDLTLAGDPIRGQYVLRVSGCIACHTRIKSEGPLLAGGEPIISPFGAFYPPNITPHPEAGIGHWTLADFVKSMTQGEGPNGKHYYPAYPFDNYTRMTSQDLADLWAALREVPQVAQKAPDHEVGFPLNIRLVMLAWKNMFLDTTPFVPNPEKSDIWNRGAYLVNGPAHCSACHTPRTLLGNRLDSKHLTGTRQALDGQSVPAIDTGSLRALGYDEAVMIDVLTGGFTPAFDIPGGTMAEVITESTRHWSRSDLDAVAVYLLNNE